MSAKKWVILVAGLLVIAGIYLVVETDVFAQTEGMCVVPENSQFVQVKTGSYQVEGTDKEIFILRGIALGQPTTSSTDGNDTIPACFSEEEGLQTFKNLYLLDKKGNRLTLIKGVGSDGSSVPIPLP